MAITILLAIHITATATMIVLILLQRSEGGALGIGGGGGGFVTGRGAANFLTRTTSILAAIFFITSITLGVISHRTAPTSAVLPAPAEKGQTAPAPAPFEKAPDNLPDLKLPKLTPELPKTPAPAAPTPQLPQSQ
jgi:preprotein translocase subunit SecG